MAININNLITYSSNSIQSLLSNEQLPQVSAEIPDNMRFRKGIRPDAVCTLVERIIRTCKFNCEDFDPKLVRSLRDNHLRYIRAKIDGPKRQGRILQFNKTIFESIAGDPVTTLQVLSLQTELTIQEMGYVEKALYAVAQEQSWLRIWLYDCFLAYLSELIRDRQASFPLVTRPNNNGHSVLFKKDGRYSPEACILIEYLCLKGSEDQIKHRLEKILDTSAFVDEASGEVLHFFELENMISESTKFSGLTVQLRTCIKNQLFDTRENLSKTMVASLREYSESTDKMIEIINRSEEAFASKELLDFTKKRLSDLIGLATQPHSLSISDVYRTGHSLYKAARKHNRAFSSATAPAILHRKMLSPQQFESIVFKNFSTDYVENAFNKLDQKIIANLLKSDRVTTCVERIATYFSIFSYYDRNIFYSFETTLKQHKLKQCFIQPKDEESFEHELVQQTAHSKPQLKRDNGKQSDTHLQASFSISTASMAHEEEADDVADEQLVEKISSLSLHATTSTSAASSDTAAFGQWTKVTRKHKIKEAKSVRGSGSIVRGDWGELRAALSLESLSVHWHVEKMFLKKSSLQSTSGQVDRNTLDHSYPLIIASIIIAKTKPFLAFSSHRNQDDKRYQCVGAIHYKNSGQKVFGIFTESVFSKDNSDGKEGQLFHHCFIEKSPNDCIEALKRGRKGQAVEIEEKNEILQQGEQTSSVKPCLSYKHAIEKRKYSTVVYDLLENVEYSLAFPLESSLTGDISEITP